MAAAASAPTGPGCGESRPLPGRCVLRLRRLPPKRGCGRGGGDVPPGLGRGFKVLEVRRRDRSKDEKWRKGADREESGGEKGALEGGLRGRSIGVGEP